MSKTFRVGLEHVPDRPRGYGEDYREFVTVSEGEDEAEKIRQAVIRLASDIQLGDGHRIAVQQWFR